jgi:pimeloyl-ACP methyl ester carboxylesterase
VNYWQTDYDWRRVETRLNALPQFITKIDGLDIHFIHVRSKHENALPLIVTHGWPGSVIEQLNIIGPLTDPTAHGANASDAFHLVIPSMPGYGFSEKPSAPGWSIERIARAWAALMPALGYERYGAQGGDWGAQVTTFIGALDPDHCAGIHLNMPLAVPPKQPLDLTEEEQADLVALAEFRKEGAAYSLEQGTKPQTLGVGLNDSPAGLLAWIVEKFQAWSDCDGDPENAFTKDQLLTNVMLYWVTGTITSSTRLYWERQHSGERGQPDVSVPTGVARYPKEILKFPRSWVERHYNVTRWEVMPRGGHFAAMEQPDLFAADVRAFFQTVS